MKTNLILLVSCIAVVFVSLVDSNSYDVKELKCQICTRVIEEIRKNISQVDSKRTISIGGFRIDDEGNYLQKSTLYYRSEVYLTELMENICNKMDDYVRATFKETGKLTVIPLIAEDGKMNPIMSEVDVVQDSDLNKSLKYYCEDILHEHDDEFVQEFSKEEENAIVNICARAAAFCDEDSIPPPTPKVVDEL